MRNELPFTGKDITGEKFGRLTVMQLLRVERRKSTPHSRYAVWKCRCDCGNEVELESGPLKSGNTSSCGCLHKELLAKMATKHGHRRPGEKPHPLYWRWQGMISRCIQKNHHGYRWYMAKGIKVCKRWRNFALFLEDMEAKFKPGLTLHRVDNSKGYNPSNVVWATWEEQHAALRKA